MVIILRNSMKREDKFGRRIYSGTVWNRMIAIGNKLIALGYRESRKKPNLFFIKVEHGVFFADLRGTKEVPIWDDQRPLFYYQFNEKLPAWKCRRLVKQELLRLSADDCKCRLSFDFSEDDPIFENTPFSVDNESAAFEWPDGLCLQCGKDFQDEGWFCSKTCELNHQLKYLKEDQIKIKCKVCGKHPEIVLKKGRYTFKEVFVEHHTDYEKNLTIRVCQSCNLKIAKNPTQYPEIFVPRISRKDFLKAKKTRKRVTKQLILGKLADRGGRLEAELVLEVTKEGGVQEDTVRRELRKLLDKKVIGKGLFSNGSQRTFAYYLLHPKKAERKAGLEQDSKQRALHEFFNN